MERRISKKIDCYMSNFKSDIKKWMDDNNMHNEPHYLEFLQYIYDYPVLCLDKEDFQKRKRVKNMVPHFDRCIAYRASEEQCTRRKQQNSDFCGTHIKGTPNGKVTDNNGDNENLKQKKLEVFAQEIKGINYYIDKNNNVYNTEDIISNSKNPLIIAKYIKSPYGEYSIPSLGM